MMEQPQNNERGSAEEWDNFRQIKGIGEASEKALHAIGIHRFSDLGGYTAEKLADLLHDRVGFISAQRIEKDGWIDQALQLSQETHEAGSAAKHEDGNQKRATPPGNHRPSGWRELADFFVSFGTDNSSGEPRLKTRAHHSQADQLMEWDGIATTALVEWMVAQGGLPQEAPAKAGDTATEEVGNLPQLEITDLWVSQVDLPPRGTHRTGQRMIRIEAQVGCAQESVMPLPPQLTAAVDIFLIDTQSSHSIFNENPAFPITEQADSHAFIQDIPVPPPGRYQLYLLGRYASPAKNATIQEGPVVKVV